MPRLYLIRHGKPSSRWGAGDDDPGLDAEGLAQAWAVRDALMALAPGDRPSRVISSPLRRCRETAQPLAAALGVAAAIDPVVGEIQTPAGLAADQRGEWLRRAARGRWRDIEGDRDYDAWRGEIAQALAGYGGAAVFSHFVAINAVLSWLAGDERVVGFQPDHASTTVLETDGLRLALIERGREGATAVL